MHDAILVLLIASFTIYGACVLSKHGPALNFLSLIVSTCAAMGVVVDRVELGDYFLMMLLPLVYVMLASIAALIIVRRE